MSIAGSNKTHDHIATVQDFTTASVSFVAGRLYLFSVSGFLFATDVADLEAINPPIITGGTWTLVEFEAHPDRNEFVAVWRFLPGSGSTTTVNWDISSTGDSGVFVWAIDEFTGEDTSGTNGSGAIVQTAVNAVDQGAAGPLVVTLAAFGSAGNAAFGAFGDNGGAGYAVGSGFTALGTDTAGARALHTEYKASSDTTVDFTWSSTDTAFQAIAIEIKAASGAAPQSAAAGMTTETDSALSFGRKKARALGVNTETDLARPITRAGFLGSAEEVDSALPITYTPPTAAPITPAALAPSGDAQLDGLVPVLGESVRFDLYDANGNLLGVLAVEYVEDDGEHIPRISNDVNRRTKRQLDGLRIPARPLVDRSTRRFYAEDIDPLSMRVRPSWLLATGEEYPMGEFLWADDSAMLWSWGEPRDCSLVDQCLVLDQDLDRNVGYSVGTNIGAALAEQAEVAGISAERRIIESSTRALSEPIAWAAGRDRRLVIFESLCSLAGFLPPYFDNDGRLVCRSAPDLVSAAPDFRYGLGVGRVIPGTPVRSSDILNAPNRYVVIDSSAQDSELVGMFDVPDSAPHSFANRHIHVVRTLDLQGLTDQAAADDAAAAAYAADSSTYSWLAFSTPPDPRADTFDVVAFEEVNYRRLSWAVELRPGRTMTHNARGTYS